MYQTGHNLRQVGSVIVRLGVLAGVLLVFGLCVATRAFAGYEQVGIFAGSLTAPMEPGVFPEEVQLGGVGGMAVNYTGAGGVPAGTVYAVSFSFREGNPWVSMYEPKAGGGLEFREAWEVMTLLAGPYKRCGLPAGLNACKPRATGAQGGWGDVDVDQATGNVYAFDGGEVSQTGVQTIIEYGPDGSKEITRFGELAPGTATVAESPEKFHSSFYAGGMAVDGSGRVYVLDEHNLGESYERLMVFEPDSPGEYEHYKYVGEVAASAQGEGKLPSGPVTDAAGNVYVGGGRESNYIQEYARETPAPYHTHHSTPICSFEYSKGGITGVTVNPETGEVFFFSNKAPKRIHRLGSCDTSTGKFGAEVEELAWSPEREDIWALAFDPVQKFSVGREAGILYGGSPDPGHAKGQSSLGYIFAPEEENPPTIAGEAAAKVTTSSAQLHAEVDPKGFVTSYAFQYLTEAEYDANEPDERQSVTVSATGGLFRLGFGANSSGGVVKANLTAGSRVASGLTVSEGNAVVGEALEGSGIAAGTTISAVEPGKLTLSVPAGASGSGVVLQAGIAFDASAGQVRRVLEGLGAIGPRNIEVSGGPGDVAGSNPYVVTFTGALGNTNLSDLSADGSQLAGGGAGVVVQGLRDGGNGFVGASEAPVGSGKLEGAGSRGVAVTLTGLLPGTAYRYRVVAQSGCAPKEPSKICKAEGASQGIRTFPSEAAGLPDGRAYELVSPADKHGGQVLPADPSIFSCVGFDCKPGDLYTHFPMLSGPEGNSIAYEGTPFAESGGGTIENEYVARRDEKAGWQTTNPTPSLLQSGNTQGYMGISSDLANGVLRQLGPQTLSPEAPSEYANLYTQPSADPLALTPLVSMTPPNRPPTGSGQFDVSYAGASADGSRVFFEANDALTEEVSGVAPAAQDGGASKHNLYEWVAGQLRLVNVKPGDTQTEAGAGFGTGSVDAVDAGSAHAISTDGDRVFWSDESGQVYVRIDGQRTSEIPDHTGGFLSAATDGARVLLSDGRIYGHLDQEIPVEEADLAQGQGGFQGILGQGEDLTHVYFVDTAVLSGEEEDEAGSVAREGAYNLYVWDEGATRFITTLETMDNSTAGSGGSGGGIADWVSSPPERTAQASPDGRWVAFLSRSPLTGYDNTGPCEEDSGTGVFLQTPCPEAFVYDSVSGRLVCTSCDRSGAGPSGWAVLRRVKGAIYLPSYLSDSGRLFFDTEDSLSPADTNNGVEDVYEWEPKSIGSCGEVSGCVALISSGREGSDSNFLATDPSGKNVFFTTRDRLLPADTDELVDLYDAREGGGIAKESESLAKECVGETCPGAPSLPPLESAPGSFAFSGIGNPIAPTPLVNTIVKPKNKVLTRAQQLAKALTVCHKKKPKKARLSCEKTAHKKYGANTKGKKTVVSNRKGGK